MLLLRNEEQHQVPSHRCNLMCETHTLLKTVAPTALHLKETEVQRSPRENRAEGDAEGTGEECRDSATDMDRYSESIVRELRGLSSMDESDAIRTAGTAKILEGNAINAIEFYKIILLHLSLSPSLPLLF